MMRSTLAVTTTILVLAACASSSSPYSSGSASTACTVDTDCSGNLKCLGLATFDADGGCTVSSKACSTACTNDTDCASLGAKFKCFASCGTAKACGATP